jgi:TIR domain
MEAFVARSFGRKILPIMVENCYDTLNSHEETRGLQDTFMVRLHRLSAVGLPITKMDMFDRLVAAIQHAHRSVAASECLVYVSYARDAEFATELANKLSKRQIPIWIATQNVLVRENWRDAQARAMLRASCHLIVLDDEMLNRHVMRTEILLAEARGLPTISVLPPRLSTSVESGVTLRKALEGADQTYRRITEATFFRSGDEIEKVSDQLATKLKPVMRGVRCSISQESSNCVGLSKPCAAVNTGCKLETQQTS